MKTEQELKDQVTPEFIKWCCEYAKGFGYLDYILSQSSILEQERFNNIIFPFLLYRAVEGWNKKEENILKEIIVYNNSVKLIEYKEAREGGFDLFAIVMKKFENYQPQSLTQAECAILHCLLDIFQKEVK
jgi:hypothetical protein